MPLKVSLVLIVKDEENNIRRCLESSQNVVDEIIVVDTGSTDNTMDLAREMGAKVFEYIWEDDFSKARNFAISMATGDWIISLDADEYFKEDYSVEIRNFINQGNKIGRVRIISNFFSDGLTKVSQTYISRIFPRDVRYIGRIHEQLNTNLERINLKVDLLHNGYFMTNKSIRNIKLLEKELEINSNDSYYLYQMAREYRNLEDFAQALEYISRSYQLLNRRESFAQYVILEYLNTCIKGKYLNEAFKIINKESEYMSNSSDFHFSVGLFLMEYLMENVNEETITKLPLIEKEFLTCLKIGKQNENVRGTGSFMAEYNLGVYYEVIGNLSLAKKYYKESSLQNFVPAIQRLKQFIL